MTAIILAGGEGKRLHPLTSKLPKALVPVHGVPIAERTLHALPESIDSIIFVIGRFGEQIQTRFGASFAGTPIRYVHQTEPKGTADALWRAQALVSEHTPFLVLNGDDYYAKEDLRQLINYAPAMGVTKDGVIPGKDYLSIRLNNEGYIEGADEEIFKTHSHPSVIAIRVTGIHELYINAGAYVLDRRIFDYPPVQISGGEFGLPHTALLYSKDHPMKVVEMPQWLPLNTHEDLARLENALGKRV